MGGNQSSNLTPPSDEDSVFHLHCKELYTELRSKSDSTSQFPLKDAFISLFGGSSVELGDRLYAYLFNNESESSSSSEISFDAFFFALKKLRTVLSQDSKEISKFILSLFLTSSDLKSDLQILLHASVSRALHIGLGQGFSIPHDDPYLSAVVSAMMQCDAQLETQYQQWLAVQSPRMFLGLSHWLRAILSPSPESAIYHLPVVDCKPERLLQFNILLWLVSCVLPTVFLGGVQSQTTRKEVIHQDLPSGGTWTCLYSSRDHGFSLNRFQHHCFDYKQPSVMIVHCQRKEKDHVHSFILAMDSEWRDGTYFYGGTDFCFIQLQPKYSFIKRGAKLVSFNEKHRGFPSGLRIMDSQQHKYCVFEMKASLDEARLHEGEWMVVQLVEVWGCGGVQAKETQQRIKEWEAKEVLRRREINSKQLLTTWEDNPDRHLLELGGIATARPRENL